MKKTLIALSLLACGGLAEAVTFGPVNISSGTGFYAIDTSSITSTGRYRQIIAVGDPNSSAGIAPVDQVTGLAISISTSALTTATAVKVDGSAVTQPVSGTFFQATQPISGTVGVTGSTVGINGTVPVSGTFFQSVQPVYVNNPTTSTISGLVNVTGSTVGISGTVPVSGTFFQTTQPISGNVGQVGTYTVTAGTGIFSTSQVGSVTVTPGTGTFTTTASTVGVVNGGSTFNVTVNAALPAGTNAIGKINFNAPTTAALTSMAISSSTTGDVVVVSTQSSQTVRVFKMLLTVNASTNLIFKSGGSSSLSGALSMSTGGSVVIDFDGEPWYVTASGQAFIINQSGTATIAGTIWYTQS